MQKNTRKGFTLIELLIVVVIIGILAAIAIPKFAATKDKAKLASVKTDVRNIMSAMEAAASDSGAYPTTLTEGTHYTKSNGNTVSAAAGNAAGNGYTITVTNTSITTGQKTCTVKAGADASGAPTEDGKIICS
jgi:prepilin-type N-terminal cleavage/methylation domain-containing protein